MPSLRRGGLRSAGRRLDHPDFGRAFPCRCVLDEREEERLTRLQRYSNLGPLTRLTFDNLMTARPQHRRPRTRSASRRRWRRHGSSPAEPGGWLVFCGPSGCGKTHLAAAIANGAIEMGQPTLFVVVPDLLDHLRAAYKPAASELPYDELFEQVRNTPLVVLDDLGAHSATPWAQEKLFQLINHRYNHRLPTVFTTSRPVEEIWTSGCAPA